MTTATLTPAAAKTLARLVEIRESLKVELAAMGFSNPEGRGRRVDELARIRRQIDAITGE